MEKMTQITTLEIPREDEHVIEFRDTRKFAVNKWTTTLDAQEIGPHDRSKAKLVDSYEEFGNWIRRTIAENRYAQQKSSLQKVLDLANPLWRFITAFEKLVSPEPVDLSMLWGLVYINVTLAIPTNLNLNPSNEKLKRISSWLGLTLRRALEKVNQCVDNSTDENTTRMQLTDVFEPLLQMLNELIKFQRTHVADSIFAKEVGNMKESVKEYIDEIDGVISHFRETSKHSRNLEGAQLNRYNNVRDLPFNEHSSRYDYTSFPVDNLPNTRTSNFFGRESSLERIDKFLGDQNDERLRTYLIYGRRGVGKTQIALEYASRYKTKFDAVFWIQCETSASLRQSFADIACALDLPGADKNGHFEENQLKVLSWLKKTSRTWLLIYDNAEREQELNAYWPKESTIGSILLTSRSYYNFEHQERREGETIPIFTEDERWELLMHLLGRDWQTKHLGGPQGEAERGAATELLRHLGGLALAINQAANMILDKKTTGDQSIVTILRTFKEARAKLPPRLNGTRDAMNHSLDTVWSIALNALSADARSLLGVFSLLAPDSISLQLFLPTKQSRLDGRLAFCKQENPTTAVEMSRKMKEAVSELKEAGLIRQDKLMFTIHRVIQEAMNFMDLNDLQSSFDAATQLLHEAFPLRLQGKPLHDKWPTCQKFVQHVVHLCNAFVVYRRGRQGTIVPGVDFVRVLSNCGWYLYEVADYVECRKMIDVAMSAADDKSNLLYADLLNTLGCIHYDLNHAKKCRDAFETVRQIREEKLEPNDLQLAMILANLGNVETGEGNLDEAQDILENAARIRESYGEDLVLGLGLIHLQLGRVEFLRGDTYQAIRRYDKAETCFVRKNDRVFTSHLHYARGNLEFECRDYKQAYFQYEKCRDTCDKVSPAQPLAAHAFYKLACVEFARGVKHHDRALSFLEKAYNIADLRSPADIDGTKARILWKKAEVLMEDPIRSSEGSKLREDMQQALKELKDDLGLDLDDEMNEDQQFDMLVPGFFR